MTIEELCQSMSECLNCSIDETSSMETVIGWDSLNHVLMLMSIGDRFGVDIPMTSLGQLTSVADIVDFFKDSGLL